MTFVLKTTDGIGHVWAQEFETDGELQDAIEHARIRGLWIKWGERKD
jgi:hypothetical protein